MLTPAALAEVQKIAPPGRRVTPAELVEQARSSNSALHRYFNWNDSAAAHEYRIIQARQVLKAVARVLPSRAPITHEVTVRHSPAVAPVLQSFVAATDPDPARLAVLRTGLANFQEEFRDEPGFDRVFDQLFAVVDKLAPRRPMFGGATRDDGGAMSRFQMRPYTKADGAHVNRAGAALPPDHRAIVEGRTLFPTRVFDADEGAHVLVPGHNNAKVGDFVAKGPWAGMQIFTLTLEERATCPPSCGLWEECYGNAMPLAKRRRHGPELMARLDEELRGLGGVHPAGFVVRLHVLGDFPDLGYAQAWAGWMVSIPQLHVFGYTAHPARSQIGAALADLNDAYSERFVIRFSVGPETAIQPHQVTTVWRKGRGQVEEGLVCPVSSNDTLACGTCGLCWHPAMSTTRIVFLGHGMNHGVRRQDNLASVPAEVGETIVDTVPLAVDAMPTPSPHHTVFPSHRIEPDRRGVSIAERPPSASVAPPSPARVTVSNLEKVATPAPPAPASKPSTRAKVRDIEQEARACHEQLSPGERKMLAYLPADGSRRAVSGAGMEMLIRYLWEKFPNVPLVSAEMVDGVTMARLEPAGKLVRGMAARG